MIIIKIQGGLGNQLLQYSIGYCIAKDLQKEVAYDVSFFEENTKYTRRPYLLDKFTIDVRIATKDEIQKVKYPYGKLSEYYTLFKKALNKYYFKKYYIGYDKNFFAHVAKHDSLYLEGFWQSYKYYENNLIELSKRISLRDTSVIDTAKNELSFNTKLPVLVHIRRGDFVGEGNSNQALSVEYYKKAVDAFEKKVSRHTYYIFSDDITWVKQELGHLFRDSINSVFVSTLGMKDYEEFSLMKDCQHAILSNSTFCWFSTLLTNSQDKIVIYPRDWKNPYLNDDPDICPAQWQGV